MSALLNRSRQSLRAFFARPKFEYADFIRVHDYKARNAAPFAGFELFLRPPRCM